MKILVTVKQVPDSTTNIKIKPDGAGIELAGVKMVVDPFAEFAIEQAVQLKEKRSDVESVTALTIGQAGAAEVLRTALAVGADDGLHLEGEIFDHIDELQTAAIIAAIVKESGYGLILRGKQEIDLDSGALGPAMAEALDWPHVGAVTQLTVSADGNSFIAHRRIEGAEEKVEVPLPAVITCEKGLCEMRYPSLPNLMKAKKKPIKAVKVVEMPDFQNIIGAVGGTKTIKYAPPPQRPPGKILKGEAADTVKELVQLLRNEAKAI